MNVEVSNACALSLLNLTDELNFLKGHIESMDIAGVKPS